MTASPLAKEDAMDRREWLLPSAICVWRTELALLYSGETAAKGARILCDMAESAAILEHTDFARNLREMDCMAAELGRLREVNAELERDAERYRWLRTEGLGWFAWEKLTTETCDVGLDYAIDSALAAQVQK